MVSPVPPFGLASVTSVQGRGGRQGASKRESALRPGGECSAVARIRKVLEAIFVSCEAEVAAMVGEGYASTVQHVLVCD